MDNSNSLSAEPRAGEVIGADNVRDGCDSHTAEPETGLLSGIERVPVITVTHFLQYRFKGGLVRDLKEIATHFLQRQWQALSVRLEENWGQPLLTSCSGRWAWSV